MTLLTWIMAAAMTGSSGPRGLIEFSTELRCTSVPDGLSIFSPETGRWMKVKLHGVTFPTASRMRRSAVRYIVMATRRKGVEVEFADHANKSRREVYIYYREPGSSIDVLYSLAGMLMSSGLARWDRRNCPSCSLWSQAEDLARRHHLGMWASPRLLPRGR